MTSCSQIRKVNSFSFCGAHLTSTELTAVVTSLLPKQNYISNKFELELRAKVLTHWGRVTYISVGKLIIIGSDNGLSPDRRQAIIWTNARLLSIGHLGTYFNENLIKIQQFPLKKVHVKMSSAKWRPSCLGLNVLMICNHSAPNRWQAIVPSNDTLQRQIYAS